MTCRGSGRMQPALLSPGSPPPLTGRMSSIGVLDLLSTKREKVIIAFSGRLLGPSLNWPKSPKTFPPSLSDGELACQARAQGCCAPSLAGPLRPPCSARPARPSSTALHRQASASFFLPPLPPSRCCSALAPRLGTPLPSQQVPPEARGTPRRGPCTRLGRTRPARPRPGPRCDAPTPSPVSAQALPPVTGRQASPGAAFAIPTRASTSDTCSLQHRLQPSPALLLRLCTLPNRCLGATWRTSSVHRGPSERLRQGTLRDSQHAGAALPRQPSSSPRPCCDPRPTNISRNKVTGCSATYSAPATFPAASPGRRRPHTTPPEHQQGRRPLQHKSHAAGSAVFCSRARTSSAPSPDRYCPAYIAINTNISRANATTEGLQRVGNNPCSLLHTKCSDQIL